MITFPEISRERFDAVLFDLDGVLTATATVHAAAWKQMFDMFLQRWAEAHGRDFIPFDSGEDYRRYVDGKPRFDGVRSFLVSRGIDLPDGAPTDPLTTETGFTTLYASRGFLIHPSPARSTRVSSA